MTREANHPDNDQTWAGPLPEAGRHLIHDQALRDDVVRTLWRIGGTACAGDLANELPAPMSAALLIPVLDDLSEHGVLRKETDPSASNDPRDCIYRTVYRLAR